MKILIVGGSGTIGAKISQHFKTKHEVLIAGRNSGDVHVNIDDSNSIKEMFQAVGRIDALINASGESKWASFNELTEEDYYIGIRSKLMGQVNLTRLAIDHLNDGGSITLTTGVLADDPVLMTASAAMVNGAIHSFVMATALELPRQIRINVVSPGLVEDSVEKYGDYFPGYNPIPWYKVINGYERSLSGHKTGEVIRIYDNA